MKSLILMPILLVFSFAALAKPPVTKIINGTEATQIIKQLVPEGQTWGNLFTKNDSKVLGCRVLVTTAKDEDNYSEVLVVNEKTYRPTPARIWFAKGVEYKYTRQDMAEEPDDEEDFYVHHTFQPKNSDKYTVVFEEDGDAGFDVVFKINKDAEDLDVLCQTDF
ncbi:MAG: hypothetical protein KDD33_07295 [Bdellovibrionales bacterium]|nr:hypothetical protein [Bdellovibrionales bacterium]